MSGNEHSGGHNITLAVSGRVGSPAPVWPWERRRLRRDGTFPRRWSQARIRNHVERSYLEQGVPLGPPARDALSALARAHYRQQLASEAIALYEAALEDFDPDEDDHPRPPLVGLRDAYAVQSGADLDIRRALTTLGLWPLKRAPEPDVADPDDEDFSQPVYAKPFLVSR